jgi:hypothetical protein
MLNLQIFIVLLMFLFGCSSTVQIAGSSAEFLGPDPAGGKKGLQYDKQSLGNLDVYANAKHTGKGNIEGGYRINLYVVNNSQKAIVFSPKLVLRTKMGAELYAVDYVSFVNYASQLQNAPSPKIPEYRKQDMIIMGTARDQLGNNYNFNARARDRVSGAEQFTRGYEQGAVIGDAIAQIATVSAGRNLINWGENYYIRPSYKIKSGGKILLTAYFPKKKPFKEEVELTIYSNKDSVKF